jgi:hypothetical protein
MRCLAAGKVFYKLNDPHVVYYQNPQGLSTRPDSRGAEEARHILKAYGRRLVSQNLVKPKDHFFRDVVGGQTVGLPGLSRFAAVQLALRALSMRSRQEERRKSSAVV